MKKRIEVHYSGRVQGVGFRYTADRLAQHFPVTGYVRNLPSGSVELVAEGEKTDLEDFLKAIRDAMRSNIQHEDLRWAEATEAFHHFGIAH